MKTLARLFLCCTAAVSLPAAADTFTFDLSGDGNHAIWTMDSAIPPSFSTAFAAAYGLVPMVINGVETVRNIQFYTAASGGALDVFLGEESPAFYSTGPVLFEGSTEAPAFLTGTFNLTGYFNPSIAYVLTVSAVPEPATWMLLLGGAGLITSVARRRTAQPAC